jgi:chemosensory pili system protein ChpA (sensor histidine kinase/response regulator)
VIDELFTLLSEQDEMTDGISKLAQEQASGELSIFLFDIFDRAQDYPPVELVDALPDIAEDFVSGLTLMLEEEETLNSIKKVNNELKGAVSEETGVTAETAAETDEKPEEHPEEELYSFTDYIDVYFTNELETALFAKLSEDDTNSLLRFTQLLIDNLKKTTAKKAPFDIREIVSKLREIFPWKVSKRYEPSKIMSAFAQAFEDYTAKISEIDLKLIDESLQAGKLIFPKEKERLSKEEIPEKPITIDSLLSEYFQAEVDEYIEKLNKEFSNLDYDPGSSEYLNNLVEILHSFKEISMIHGYVILEDFCSDILKMASIAKKQNQIFNTESKQAVEEILSIIKQTDKIKDAKQETPESIRMREITEIFKSDLFVTPAPSKKKKKDKVRKRKEETFSGKDSSSLLNILKDVFIEIEPQLWKDLTSDKRDIEHISNTLSTLEEAAETIDQAEIQKFINQFKDCITISNKLSKEKYDLASEALSDIYKSFISKISVDFLYQDLDSEISDYKDKFIPERQSFSVGDSSQLLSILMDTENSNLDTFSDVIHAKAADRNTDRLSLQINHFQNLTKNFILINCNRYSSFSDYYANILESQDLSKLSKMQRDLLDQTYRSLIKIIQSEGISAEIEDQLNTLRDTFEGSDKEAPSSETAETIDVSDEVQKSQETPEVSEEEDLDEIFKQESDNYIATIRNEISIIENDPDKRDAYENIERSLHSLKSSARLMGFNNIADLAGPFEELFETLHATGQSLTKENFDIVKEVFHGLETGIIGQEIDVNSLVKKLKSIRGDTSIAASRANRSEVEEDLVIKEEQLFAVSADEEDDLLDIFKEESSEYIATVEAANDTLRQSPDDNSALGQLENAIHSLKTAAKMLGFSEISQLSDSIEKVAVALQRGEISNNNYINQKLTEAVGLIKELTEGNKKNINKINLICSQLDPQQIISKTSPEDDSSERKNEVGLDEDTELFIKEGGDLLEKINRDLLSLEKNPKDQKLLDNLNRHVHTLKGSAQILDFKNIGTLAHKIEDLFAQAKTSKTELNENVMDLVFKAVDTIQDFMEAIKIGKSDKTAGLEGIIHQIDEIMRPLPETDDEGKMPLATEPRPKVMAMDQDIELRKDTDQVIKVTTDNLDNLVNMAAELVINKTQLSSYLDKLKNIGATFSEDKKKLNKTNRTINSFLDNAKEKEEVKETLSELDKDVLNDLSEISEEFGDIINAYDRVTKSFRLITQEFEENLSQISTLTKLLHDDILQVRMVPTEMLFNRFPRAVRDMAKKLKKKVNLVVEGAETEMDRALVESLTDPLMHLVRNAIDHGLETPSERKAVGKNEDGIILLKAKRSKNQILIEVQDDGKGIDPELVKSEIIKNNLADKKAVNEMSVNEVLDHVFHPGFSTKETASDVSGRGVGLDVVADQIQNLKGDIRISSTPGKGSIFSIRVPLTLAIAQAILVKVGTETMAIPLASVEETVQFKDPELVEKDEKAFITVRDQLIPVAYLSSLLDYQTEKKPVKKGSSDSNTAIIVQEAGARYGLIVDQVLGREEIVIKSLGDHLAHVSYISGGTIFGDGSVGLILDISSITQKIEIDVYGEEKDFSAIERAREVVTEELKKETTAKSDEKKKKEKIDIKFDVNKKTVKGRAPKALIIDDSQSVLKFVSSVLERNKYETVLAEDGPEALEELRKSKFDIIITDLEMPKMHGYDLITEIRKYKKYQTIPIVILTGRAGKKHKDKGMKLGANAYITKPFKENDLLKSLESFIEIV